MESEILQKPESDKMPFVFVSYSKKEWEIDLPFWNQGMKTPKNFFLGETPTPMVSEGWKEIKKYLDDDMYIISILGSMWPEGESEEQINLFFNLLKEKKTQKKNISFIFMMDYISSSTQKHFIDQIKQMIQNEGLKIIMIFEPGDTMQDFIEEIQTHIAVKIGQKNTEKKFFSVNV